jgi:hypothetical protein
MPLILSGTDGVQSNSGAFVADTAKTASGTSVDFTGIPSWVKRVTVIFSAVSWSTTTPYIRVQLGDSGGFEITGYTGAQTVITSGATVGFPVSYSAGFDLSSMGVNTDTITGSFVLNLISGNTWVGNGLVVRLSGGGTQVLSQNAGQKSLSATLTQIRVTTSNGTDTFDAGTINILYE